MLLLLSPGPGDPYRLFQEPVLRLKPLQLERFNRLISFRRKSSGATLFNAHKRMLNVLSGVLQFELIRGPDLLDHLEYCGGRIPEPLARFYFRQLARAIEHMHTNEFCHRDLKLENVMIDLQDTECEGGTLPSRWLHYCLMLLGVHCKYSQYLDTAATMMS